MTTVSSSSSVSLSCLLTSVRIDSQLEGCVLLDESLGASSELVAFPSKDSFSDVPPFPGDRNCPIISLLGLDVHLLACTGKESPSRIGSQQDALPSVTSVPTPPRLSSFLTETVNIKKWTAGITTSHYMAHSPWIFEEPGPATPWVAEGSAYPPAEYKHALSDIHSGRARRDGSQIRKDFSCPASIQQCSRRDTPVYGRPKAASSLVKYHASAPHKSPIFDREAAGKAEDECGRLSVQTPGVNTNPDTMLIDILLNSEDLGSYHLQNPDDVSTPLRPPTLTVSTSDTTLPLSIQGSPETPEPLAVRRGKPALPALSMPKKETLSDDSYPSIPTAFLGSPSTYSPRFEYGGGGGDADMTATDMIARLRSCCASMGPLPSPVMRGFAVDCDQDHVPPGCTSDSSFSSDGSDWAFAADFMQCYGDERPPPGPVTVTAAPESSSHRTSGRCSLPDAQECRHAGADDVAAALDSPSPALSQGAAPRDSLKAPQDIVAARPRPPSTPLPPPPEKTPRPAPRGILKSAKSVRFKLDKDDGEHRDGSLTTLATSLSASPSPSSSSNQARPRDHYATSATAPSPLRNTFFPGSDPNNEPRLSRPTSSISPASSNPAPTKGKRASGRARARQSLDPQILFNVPVLTVDPASKERRATISHAPHPVPAAAAKADAPRRAVRKVASSLGRYTLSPARGKENAAPQAPPKPTPQKRPARARSFTAADENSARRGSVAAGAQKNRMSTPLRSILSRFK